MIITLRDTVHDQVIDLTLDQVLFEINRDRSEEWTDYNEDDWMEGLTMTDYELVKVTY